MVRLVALFQATQNCHGVFNTRLAHKNLLETALQGGVFLNKLPILIEGGCANEAQLASGKHGLEHIGGSNGSLAATGTHQRVKLIDEGDDLALGVVDFFENRLQALFKLTPVFSTRNDCRHIERNQLLSLQGISDIASNDALSQSLDDGGLTNTWFTNEDGIVLGPPGQHLRHATDFLVTSNHGVQFSLAGNIGEIETVELQCALWALFIG
ncbi:unannotated protein [freshwater metagenome]|uniref:Unannotated protein n=1 Tax=freshwater metagenome TaxID=449393 RepID=A0A6J6KPA0_9ZZZZ